MISRYTLIAAAIASSLTCSALSVLSHNNKEHPAVGVKADKEQCDLRLWVRAEDLSPSTIIEGDVRLLNNMSSLSPTFASGCKVLEWSLHLRYRERAAIQIPLSNMQLPTKPSYNYTWDTGSNRGDEQYAIQRMMLEGEDMNSLFETVKDPYEKDREEYYRQLEEYVKAVSNADHWIIREEEVVFFETSQNMSKLVDYDQDLQHIVLPFGIAVPAVRFPEAAERRSHWNDQDFTERILHTDEKDMSYFAKIHLANGSTVEINGGRTKFFTPGREEDSQMPSKTAVLSLVQQDRKCGSASYSAVDGSIREVFPDEKPDDTLPRPHISATIEAPTNIVRGKSVIVKGQITSDEYIPTRIWIDIHTQRKLKWAHEQIRKVGSATSRNKTDFIKDYGSGLIFTDQNKQDYSSALFLQQQIREHIDKIDAEEEPDFFNRKSIFRRPSNGVAINANDGIFSMKYKTGNDFHGHGSTFFAEHKAEFRVKVEAKRKQKKLSGKVLVPMRVKGMYDPHQQLQDEHQQWSEHENTHIWGSFNSKASSQSDEEEKSFVFEGSMPIDGFSNEPVKLEKRDNLLQDLLERQEAQCSSEAKASLDYLAKGALAPFFVDLSNEDLIRVAVPLINPCTKQSQNTQSINTMPTLRQHIPTLLVDHPMQRDQSKGDVKYRKTKYSSREFEKQECWQNPGSCGGAIQDAGTVWINKIMLPKMKLDRNSAAEGKEDQRQDTTPNFVLQR